MSKIRYIKISLILLMVVLVSTEACRKPVALTEEEENEWLSGGAQTVFNSGGGAFGEPFTNLSEHNSFNHGVGDGVFGATFVSAPAPVRPGLGPIFNAVSCVSCHIADGRGKPPGTGESMISLLLRISVPGTDEDGGPLPVPGFGSQLQNRAIAGAVPEASINLQYAYQTYTFPDGETYELRSPTYSIDNPYTALPGDIMISPRIAMPVYGTGLLEAIPEWMILSREDVNDANGDGISGKANHVWDAVNHKMALGRFGWKAAVPSLIQQSALAFNQDIGITSSIYRSENCYGQPQYDNKDDDYEISDSLLDAVAFYIRTLAVPARRNVNDVQVKKGKQIFTEAGCVKCHVPMSKTDVNVAFPEMSNQTIFPYTDLLLHDMGEDLADGRTDFLATNREWRTRPLWGVGLTKIVSGHTYLLHDGRARNFIEAVMWHGGEATQAQQHVFNLSKADRDALVKFLESL